MTLVPFNSFLCPLDGLALSRQDKSLKCENGHCFDFDRKGTVNLLPVQFKKSLEPGDSKEMVAARNRFLQSGAYAPVSMALNELIEWQNKPVFSCLDAGCGEGYYTANFAEHYTRVNKGGQLSLVGLDISKYAIQSAVNRTRDIQWVVGTNAHLPIADHSLDVVLCLFGFPVWEEFRRVLKPDGMVICADPGPEHLIELRRILYAEIKEKNTRDVPVQGFDAPEITRVHQGIIPPTPDLIEAQIMMTPHGYRASAQDIKRAADTLYNAITLDVVFSKYRVAHS